MNKRTLIFIAGGAFVLLLGGFLIYNGIQNAQVRNWVENSMAPEFNPDSDTGNVYLPDEKMPAKLRRDKDLAEAYEELSEAVGKYNDQVRELDQNVDELVHDLSTYGKDRNYRYMSIPVQRYGVDVAWFSLQSHYAAYVIAVDSYWVEHYPNAAIPLMRVPKCDFVYSIEEVVPENGLINGIKSLYGLSKRQCTFNESLDSTGQAGMPEAEEAVEEAAPQATATTVPTPTAQPLYATSSHLGFDWGYTYDNGSSIYVVKKTGAGQKVVAYDITGDELDFRTLFTIEPSPLNEQDFLVSADEQYIVSGKRVWRIDSGEMVKEMDFPTLALSPDNTQLVGYQTDWTEGPSYPISVYDFPNLNKAQDLMVLEAPDGRSIAFNWSAFSGTGKYFALSYLMRSIENGSTDPVDSGLVVWETTDWTQVLSLQGDGATLYDQGVFSADDNFMAVSVKTFAPGGYLYSPYTRVELIDLSDPQAVSSLSYNMQTPNVSVMALGQRIGSLIVLACRMGNSQQIEIEVVEAANGELLDSETIEDLFWPYFTRSGILYGTGYGTQQPYQVYLPGE
ncbi:WD40 repeat domain-containing protein [Pelolinea submarina]|uniref:Uncharacterized protein n=1 Tax=Pelolinea submarina TaxID=913107 RepID=A0A347ZNM9_9CHLR|nr:hypothetical protein [Pelolinea submarina]REG08513.1 hypothetical protein DFR64_1881 [Pelolinea submarina]BBB46910.1 hypothetical protein Pelsub_P0137 [Pelolinea submarina]